MSLRVRVPRLTSWPRSAATLLLGAGVVAALLPASPALAHADLVSSTPANGEQVLTPPTEITLRYSEGVQLGEMSVVAIDGSRVDKGELRIGPTDRTQLAVPLADVGDGIYTLNWQVLSEDGHTTKGSVFFIVGPEMPSREKFLALLTSSSGAGGQLNPAEPPLRGVIFLALAILLGVPIMLLLIVQPAAQASGLADGPLWQGVRRLLLVAAGTVAVAAVLLGGAQMLAASPAPTVDGAVTFATTTLSGRMALARGLLGVAVLGVLLFVRWRPVWLAAAALGALAIEGTITWTSHSATIVQGLGPTLSDYGHLLGGALWAGGLAVMAVLVPAAVAGQEPDKAVRFTARVVRRFSALAIGAVALAVATGLLLAASLLPTWSALWSTLYGSALAVKLGLLLAALALGAWHKLVLHGRLVGAMGAADAGGPRQVRLFVRSVRVELVLVVGIFLFSGLLTSAAPASAAQAASPQARSLVERVRDVDVRLTATPFQVGLNVFDVNFARDGAPITDVRDANLLMRQPDADVYLPQAKLDSVAPGLYSTLGSFTLPGDWEVRASAFVNGRFTAQVFKMSVGTPAADQPAAAGDEGFKRLLTLAAIVVALAGIVALVAELYGYRKEAGYA